EAERQRVDAGAAVDRQVAPDGDVGDRARKVSWHVDVVAAGAAIIDEVPAHIRAGVEEDPVAGAVGGVGPRVGVLIGVADPHAVDSHGAGGVAGQPYLDGVDIPGREYAGDVRRLQVELLGAGAGDAVHRRVAGDEEVVELDGFVVIAHEHRGE